MKKCLFLLAAIVSNISGIACTTFLLNKNGQLVFGRNYDWITGAGIVNTNQRGLFKTSAIEKDKKTNWISKYGSITFNQYGKEFPTGGMNEQGLVVELMWLEGTTYAAADERPAVGELQWLQYQLDLHGTVDEVIESEKNIRISSNSTTLHFLIADASGSAASIEFLDGKMVVHKADKLPFPVLTNDTYEKSIAAATQSAKTNKLPGNNSLDRFVTACKMVSELKISDNKKSLTDYAFSILDKVAQGDFTKWSIAYDISNKKIYFKTAYNSNTRSFSFNAFDFSCNTSSKMLDMNQPGTGDVSNHFTLPDKKIKLAVINRAVKESSEYVTITDAEKKLLMEFEDGIKCKN